MAYREGRSGQRREAPDGCAANRHSDTASSTGGVLVGGDREALLDQRPAYAPRLHTENNPRDLGHQEVLIGSTQRDWGIREV